MNFMTTPQEERANTKLVESGIANFSGKETLIEIRKREIEEHYYNGEIAKINNCYFLFADGVPINYWYDFNKAKSELDRICGTKWL